MADNQFIHLHLNSMFSLLRGVASPEEIVALSVSKGFAACALTDYHSSFGVYPFWDACCQKGVKPIIGNEVLVFDSRGRSGVVVLLAESDVGFCNIMELVSLALSGREIAGVSYKELAVYSEGVICLSGGRCGPVDHAIALGGDGRFELERLVNIYGRKNFFLEICRNNIAGEEGVLSTVSALSHEYVVQLVATGNVYYLTQESVPLWYRINRLRELSASKSGQPEVVDLPQEGNYRFLSEGQMVALFKDHPRAIENSVVIAKRCQFKIEMGQLRLPDWEADDPDQILQELCVNGLNKKFPPAMHSDGMQRLSKELSVIKARGLAPYFLIVADLINYAREKKIPVGPGRGSAVGSLVVYCAGITRVNPLEHNLLFERFLNLQRSDMPDIDLDIGWRRRQELFDYLAKRYGRDRVAHVATLDYYQARSAIRDAGRSLGRSTVFVDGIARLVPRYFRGENLETFYKKDKRLQEVCGASDEAAEIIKLAIEFEGRPRHVSIHAGAAVVSKEPLTSYAAFQRGAHGERVIQLTGEVAAALGLMKIDILGLRFLSVNADTAQAIPDFTSQYIQKNDPAVYAMLSEGRTTGVFQLESAGMRDMLRRLRPENIVDLTAALSLYRPGPMQGGFVEDYIQCRHGKKEINYPDPRLQRVLKETYGIFLYQEQVMLAAHLLAGFGLDDADQLRRAMSKRDRRLIEPLREKFVNSSGLTRQKGSKLFDMLAHFAGYGFNKSHATAYAVTAYLNAFFKLHYPKPFFTALLNNNIEFTSRLNNYLSEARICGIQLLPLDINKSVSFFVEEEEGIRAALLPVKQLGGRGVAHLVKERERGGPYLSLLDFCVRVSGIALDVKGVENLIKGGAFDFLLFNREQLLEILPMTMAEATRQREKTDTGQLTLFQADPTEEVEPTPDKKESLPEVRMIFLEHEAFDFYYSSHPAAVYRQALTTLGAQLVAQLATGQHVCCGGLLIEKRVVRTKKGQRMLFALFQDESGEVPIILFPAIYEKAAHYCFGGELLFCKGKITRDGSQMQFVASIVCPLKDMPGITL